MSLDEAELKPLTVVQGERVRIRHVTGRDYEFLYAIETTGTRTTRFRLQGVAPGPERFIQTIWDHTQIYFVVEDLADASLLGTLALYDADFRNGHGKIAVAFVPGISGGSALEASELFIDYLFHAFPLRKVYADALELNLVNFRSVIGSPFAEEGRLRSHQYVEGDYRDLVLLALYRQAWNERDATHLHEHGFDNGILGFDEFTERIVTFFDLPDVPDTGTRLVEDLGFDSINMFELVLFLEEVGGHEVPEAVVTSINTVGDLYDTYATYEGHRKA